MESVPYYSQNCHFERRKNLFGDKIIPGDILSKLSTLWAPEATNLPPSIRT
jgi:hypothetical protein